jgi:hypothetical protein
LNSSTSSTFDFATASVGNSWLMCPASTKEAIDLQLLQWTQRFVLLGVQCKGLALSGLGEGVDRSFPAELASANEQWADFVAEKASLPAMRHAAIGDDMLVVMLIPLSGFQARDQKGVVVGLLLSPPFTNKTLLIIQMAAASLQLLFVAEASKSAQRAIDTLELLVAIGNAQSARVAAQEWTNRTSAWARSLDVRFDDLSLTIYQVKRNNIRWWVTSESSWEEASSAAHEASANVASEALFRDSVINNDGWTAIPILNTHESGSIIVVKTKLVMESPIFNMLVASARVCFPLLEHWEKAEQPIWRHVWNSIATSFTGLTEPGKWSTKIVASIGIVVLILVTLFPVEDRVTAPLVIEGRIRMAVTSPQDGFLSKVNRRPGNRVTKGEILASLDGKELGIERDRFVALRDQAESKLRQAMAEHESVGFQAASADLRSAQAQLKLVESKINRIDLLAPVSGLVVSGDWAHQIGIPLSVGKEMFEIAADPGLRVAMHVEDLDIVRVLVDQVGILKLAGQPDQTYQFNVSQVTSVATVRDGVNGFRVEATWLGDAPSLSPGMQGIGKILVGDTVLIVKWFRPLSNWIRLKVWSMW